MNGMLIVLKFWEKLEQDSIDYAIKLNAHYFVIDCDNFIIPNVIEEMFKMEQFGVIAPMLVDHKNVFYSNYHYDIDQNGYFLQSQLYNDIVTRKITGLIVVNVVHCTYFINNKYLLDVCYDDGSNRYEYVIFSDCLRKKNIKQYLDNRVFYGLVTFCENYIEFAAQFAYINKQINPNLSLII